MTAPAPNKLIFLDIETTGLDEDKDHILELGIVIVNERFDVIGSYSEVIYYNPDFGLEVHPTVLTMHTDNGLWEECKTGRLLGAVEEDALEFLREYDIPEGDQPMCGNSIHFDRAFLNSWMPDLTDFFHYRNFDVSTFTQYMERYMPDVYEGRPKGKPHRAIPDCLNSIETMKYYHSRLRYV